MKNKVIIIAIMLIVLLMSTMFFGCAKSRVSFSLSKENIGVSINDEMYGLFLEDISYAGDGGLVSNLVQNGSFEYEYLDSKNDHFQGWKSSDIYCIISNENPLNENNTYYLHLDSSANGGNISNNGYVELYKEGTKKIDETKSNTPDMGFTKDTKYEFSCYLRNIDYEGEISARIQSENNLSTALITVPTAAEGWVKVTCELEAKYSEDGFLAIDFNGVGSIDIDFVSLVSKSSYGYESSEWKYISLRQDMLDALKELSPNFIRFPGGCLAESASIEMAQYHNVDLKEYIYNWKDSIGPLEERKQIVNIWADVDRVYNNAQSMGYHEYFQLCEDLDADAIPILNVGIPCQFEAKYNKMKKKLDSGEISREEWEDYLKTVAYTPGEEDYIQYTQDVLDLIEYANGDISTEWGAKRAANGHPEPFNIKYIGLGNENWGELYWRNFDPLYNAIKEKYPEITIVSSAGYKFTGEEKEEAWEIINSKYADTIVDEHYYTGGEKLFKNNDYYDDYDRNGAKVFLGEYASTCQFFGKHITKNNLWSAIEDASYMTGLERNGDIVSMVAYAPTFAKVNSLCWDVNLIWFDSQSIVLTPNYYAQMLFSNNIGNKVINTDVNSYGFYSTTTINEEEEAIYVKIVNSNSSSVDINIDVSDFGNINMANMQYLSDKSQAACNNINSTTIVPKQKDVENTNGTISTKIDGYSINVIRIYYGSNNGEDAYVLPDIPSTMCQDVTQYNTPYITLGAFIAIMVILGVSIIGFALIGILRHIYKKKQKE